MLTREGSNLELHNSQSVLNTQSTKQLSSENVELFLEQLELLYTKKTVLLKKKGIGYFRRSPLMAFYDCKALKPCRDKNECVVDAAVCLCLCASVFYRINFFLVSVKT